MRTIRHPMQADVPTRQSIIRIITDLHNGATRQILLRTLHAGEHARRQSQPSEEYYNRTRQNICDDKAKPYHQEFEDNSKLDRETNYNTMPTPTSPNYLQCIDHRLRFFHQAINVYTTTAYCQLSFDQYLKRQNTMDGIVNELINEHLINKKNHGDGKRILVETGATDFNTSSSIEKYKRCPGIRKITMFLRKAINCNFPILKSVLQSTSNVY